MPTPDTEAMTLAEMAGYLNDPLITKITSDFYQTYNILKDLRLVTDPSLEMAGASFTPGTAPGVAWGRLNKLPTVVKGSTEKYKEPLYLIRNKFEFDEAILNQPNKIQDPISAQFEAWNEMLQYELNDTYINNAPDINPDAWSGAKWRLDNPTLSRAAANLKRDAGGVDMSVGGLSVANANKLFREIDLTLTKMGKPDGTGVTIHVSSELMTQMNAGLRLMGQGGFKSTADAFDRSVETYKNAKIRDIGTKNDESTPVISLTESSTGTDPGNGDRTSIYFSDFSPNRVGGWQPRPLKPENLGLSKENGVMVNVVIKWGVGLFIPHSRSQARLFNIKIS